MIALSAVTMRFAGASRLALDGVTAEIRPGRITGLVGPDGAGKTTLLRLVAGLLEPSDGSVTALGLDVLRDGDRLRELLGYMPQKFGLYEELTVHENLLLHARLRGVPKEERPERFSELLRRTNLERFTDRLASKLSGGMKQKLGLACALVKKPKLLLLDEPGVGVDPISRRELWRIVRELVSDDVTVLWSTAYLDEAQECDEVLLLADGRPLFFGDPSELTRRMEGRVVLISEPDTASRRQLWRTLRKDPDVSDCVIQGRSVRMTLRRTTSEFPIGDSVLSMISERSISLASPQFEDGFIDILGGAPQTESLLMRDVKPIPDGNRPTVVARELTKRFGTFVAADRITFEIHRGEIFGLLGPNGAGKSTTFRMLCGLLKPTSGDGMIAGYDLRKSASQARSRLGYMAQKFSLYSDLTVSQNMNFFAGVYGISGRAKRLVTSRMMEIFDLVPSAATNAGRLPPGFRQRLSLACAMMHEPDVLFLDEPTSGVDPLMRREFWGHITTLVDHGITVLVTTHFMDEAEYCDRILLINGGRALALGTPDELKSQTGCDTLNNAFVHLIEGA